MAVWPSLSSWQVVPLADVGDAVEGGGSKVAGGLKKKVGPLEVWQWAAATLGVVFAYLAYKNHASNSAGGPGQAATNTTLPPGGAAPTSDTTVLSGQLTDLTGQVGALQQSVAGLSPGGGAPSTVTTNGFGSDITSLYSQIGASPDAAGAAYWGAQSQSGLLDRFVGSTPQATAGFVTQQYQSNLGRTPDAAGLAYWEGQVGKVGATQEQAQFKAATAGGAK
jgi:hypothetical protein